MESFYLLIPMTLVFCALATGLFFWAVRRRQFDDLDSAGRQILFDDDARPGQPEQPAEPPSPPSSASPREPE